MPKPKTIQPWQVTKSPRRVKAVEAHAPLRTSKTLRNNPKSRGRRTDARVFEAFLWLVYHDRPLRDSQEYPLTKVKGSGMKDASMHHRIWVWLQSPDKGKGLANMWAAYLATLSKSDVGKWRSVLLAGPCMTDTGKLDPHKWMAQLRRNTDWYRALQVGIRRECRRRGLRRAKDNDARRE
jgi:hypothetical protein